MQEQVARLMHVGNLYFNRPMVELAERLAARSLGGRVYFANSGAEANEAALKLVRKARPRGEIVVLHGGFHGRTYGALSATPQEAKQAPFAPLVPGFVAVAPDAAAIEAAVGERTAAVLLEPMQGESGVNLIDTDVLARGARGLRPHRRRARVRRDPDRHGADGHALGLRGRGRRAGRDDGRQGAGRRPADRRADHRPAARRRASRPATTAPRSPAARWSPRPPTPRSTCSTTRRCSPASASWASACRSACASCPACSPSAAAG